MPSLIFWRRFLKSLVSALWSIPVRMVTIPAIVGGMIMVSGDSLQMSDLLNVQIVFTGVVISAILRFIDTLIVEFALFPTIIKLWKCRK